MTLDIVFLELAVAVHFAIVQRPSEGGCMSIVNAILSGIGLGKVQGSNDA